MELREPRSSRVKLVVAAAARPPRGINGAQRTRQHGGGVGSEATRQRQHHGGGGNFLRWTLSR